MKPATPGLRTAEEGGAIETIPIGVGGKTPAESKKIPYCCIHGRDKGHWTSECPLIKEKKEELDRATNTEQPPKPVNYTHNIQVRDPPL